MEDIKKETKQNIENKEILEDKKIILKFSPLFFYLKTYQQQFCC